MKNENALTLVFPSDTTPERIAKFILILEDIFGEELEILDCPYENNTH